MKRWICRSLLILCAAFAVPEVSIAADARPSIVLIVIDTLRADAVSSYGAVAGTTPELDALARTGLRYERAYAPAPWTLPSHATILSGLGVEQHRVGMGTQSVLPEDVSTLAERLQAAGYETAAFSENAMVSSLFGLVQGFKSHRASQIKEADNRPLPIDGSLAVEAWLPKRDATRPFFLFVNLGDPHDPYTIRDENPFVPRDIPRELVRTRPKEPSRLICSGLPDPTMLAILRGLYLGDTRAADAKVGKIVRDVRAATRGKEPIIVVASDHGEYFGEDRLMGHEFGLHEAVLHVPLIVSGLPGAAPSTLPETVGLIDLAPSILSWAGIPVPKEMSGKPLPLKSSGAPGDRALFAFYSDATHWTPDQWREAGVSPFDPEHSRQFCRPGDPVWGGIATVIQYPHKFVWYARRKPALFDLSWDRAQKSDQSAYQPKAVERLERSIEPRVRAAGLDGSSAKTTHELSKDAHDALKALGYAD